MVINSGCFGILEKWRRLPASAQRLEAAATLGRRIARRSHPRIKKTLKLALYRMILPKPLQPLFKQGQLGARREGRAGTQTLGAFAAGDGESDGADAVTEQLSKQRPAP